MVRKPAAEKSKLCVSRKLLANASAVRRCSISAAMFSWKAITEQHLAVAAGADRGRAAGQMGVAACSSAGRAPASTPALISRFMSGPQLPVSSACAPEALILVM